MAIRAGLAWRRRSMMTLNVHEPLHATGRMRVTAPGWEATGAGGLMYRIAGQPYGQGRRKFWQLFVLQPGEDLHRRVPLAFSGILYVVQDLAGQAEASYVRTTQARERAMACSG